MNSGHHDGEDGYQKVFINSQTPLIKPPRPHHHPEFGITKLLGGASKTVGAFVIWILLYDLEVYIGVLLLKETTISLLESEVSAIIRLAA